VHGLTVDRKEGYQSISSGQYMKNPPTLNDQKTMTKEKGKTVNEYVV
jgi:hypothetical protein